MADAQPLDDPNREGLLHSEILPRPKSSKDLPKVQEHGVTVLWTPKEESEIVADVIFVHGLGGHPRMTWHWNIFKKERSFEKAKDKTDIAPESSGPLRETESESQTRDCFWPYDLVPDDFDNVRILTYGYDSHPSHFYTGRTGCRGRPIIFVAHSLGGILVKDAIILSGKYEHQPAIKDVWVSCTAIIFFGTPHQGANAAAYGEMLMNLVGALPLFPSVYKEVLRGLKPDGEKLSNVSADFNDLLNKEMPTASKIQLYSFREGKPLTNLKKFDGKVVPDTSAFFNRRDIEQTSMIMANHMDMCRFDTAQNSGYVSFRAALAGYLGPLQAQVATQQREDQGHLIAAFTQALDFGARIERQHRIARLLTSKATFEWVWSSEFAKWLVNEEPLFWISGKPGSGKSTLVYHIVKSDRTTQLLQQSFGEPTTCTYHFFDFRAAGSLGNNFAGFVRSLLVQLLSRLPHLSDRARRLCTLLPEAPQARLLDVNKLELAELSEVLLETLHTVPGRVFIALDGLDEYADEPMELVSFIKSMARKNTKVCLASRPDPPFPDAFAAMPSFKMHEVNAPGIYTFARQVLDDAAMEKHRSSHLAEAIVSQSKGVFLWARFATLEIVNRLSKGDLSPGDDLVSAIQELPTELEDLYSRIICRVSSQDRAFARVMLVYVAHAMETLRLEILQSLVQLHTHDPSPWFRDITYIDRFPENTEPFRRKILASTGGLIKIYADPDAQKPGSEIVGLLHRTVKTYLENKGWTELSLSLSDPGCEQSLWLQSCARVIHKHEDYLRSIPVDRLRRRSIPRTLFEEGTDTSESDLDQQRCGGQATPSYPSIGVRLLMAYALTHAPSHARNFEERSKLSSYSIMRHALSPLFFSAHLWFTDSLCICSSGWMSNRAMVHNIPPELRVVVAHSLNGYIQEYIDAEGNQPVHAMELMPSYPTTADIRSLLILCLHAIGRHGKHPVQKMEAIRRYAVLFAIYDRSPVRVSTLRIALQHCPTVTDGELLAAIKDAPFEALECMMRLRPSGKLLLKFEESRMSEMTVQQGLILHKHLLPSDRFVGIQMRPFWSVGKRGIHDTEAVIDLVRSRGENINERCGPFGTVLHSFFDSITGSREYQKELFDLLVAKGADVNATGPYGTVLEFAWMIAHTTMIDWSVAASRFNSGIRDLIDAGAVNNRKDPNGLVPSVERMKTFATTINSYAEARQFYEYGPRLLRRRVAPSSYAEG